MRIEREVGFPVPPERLLSVLVDWERQAGWMGDADRVEVVSPTRAGVGTTIVVATRVLGLPVLNERLEVTEWDPPRRLVIAHRRAIRGVGTWLLTAAGRGCRFRWTEDVSLPVPIVGELALRAYRPLMGRLMLRSLWRLRAQVERGPGPVRA